MDFGRKISFLQFLLLSIYIKLYIRSFLVVLIRIAYDFRKFKKRRNPELRKRKRKEEKKCVERCRIFFFFWNFWRWYLLERSHENPGEEGSALCEKFLSSPLSMMDKGEARTVTICTQTDRRASLSH